MLPRRAVLGAELPDDREAFPGDGVRLAGVTETGMAAAAKLEGGDLVLSISGRPVRDLCELTAALRHAGAAPTTELVYLRHDDRHAAIVETMPMPLRPSERAGELAVPGARLRIIEVDACTTRGLVLVLQGIACESIEHTLAVESPLDALVRGWATAGYGSIRFDKRGVGDSEGGPCREIDFETERGDARAMLEYARGRARAEQVPLFLFGHSVGGMMAPLVAANVDEVRGIVVYGAPVMPWIDCLLDSVRRQLESHHTPEHEILEALGSMQRLTVTGELNGRSASYHAQLAGLELEAAWRAIDVPVLVVRGEYDWVVDAADQARIAELARGATTILDVPHLDHLLGRHADHPASLRDYGDGATDDSLAIKVSAWLDSIKPQSSPVSILRPGD